MPREDVQEAAEVDLVRIHLEAQGPCVLASPVLQKTGVAEEQER